MQQKRSLLINGLSLTLRYWPALVWTYVFNLGLAVLFTLPLRAQLSAITANSLASQRMVGGFDLGVMAEVILKLSKAPGSAALPGYFTAPVYVLIYFLIVPGALFCYQGGAPARLSTLLQTGLVYFWRFVRITLVTLVICGPVIGGLTALQNLWSSHIDDTMVGRPAFLLEEAGLVVVLLVAALLRVYFDLVEVYTVQLALQVVPAGVEENPKRRRQMRRALKPALRALWHNFIRTYISFGFLTLLGLAAVVLTARIAVHSAGQPHSWQIFLLTQIGLFLMLLTRFWQRGAETTLALDNPMPVAVAPVVVAPVAPAIEPEPVAVVEAAPGEGRDFSI